MERSLEFSGTQQAAIEAQRAVQEAEMAAVIAHRFPRNTTSVKTEIKEACKSAIVADNALYAYKRGKKPNGKPNIVTGPSIRLAETLTQCMGNITAGVRELSREDGYSEVETFCWDIQNNVRDSKTFQVEHKRKAGGGYKTITDPRDIYEHVANYAARRKRSNMLAVIPQEVQEYAAEICRDTILFSISDDLPTALNKIIQSFQKFNITEDHIIEYLGHPFIEENGEEVLITANEILELRQIYTAIRDGMTSAEEWFNMKKSRQTSDIEDKFKKAGHHGTSAGQKKESVQEDVQKQSPAVHPNESMHPSWSGVPNVEKNLAEIRQKFAELFQQGLIQDVDSMEAFERKMGTRIDAKNCTYNKFWEIKDFLIKVERESKIKK